MWVGARHAKNSPNKVAIFFFNAKKIYLFPVYECFVGMHVCEPRTCQVPMKVRRECQPSLGTGVIEGCEPPCENKRSKSVSPVPQERDVIAQR